MSDIHGVLLCRLVDLPDPGTLEFSVGEGDWPLRGVLVKFRGTLRAYVNRCPHAGHALNLLPNRFFTPQRDLLICNSHGATFLPDSGACVGGPCVGQSLQLLDIEVVAGDVFLRGFVAGGVNQHQA